jgi:LDH2 family malate/lactate/ureidoglycolate dehydrogenase
LDVLLERLRIGTLRSPSGADMRTVAPCVALIDAADGFGQVASSTAVDVALQLAEDAGLGLACVVGSTHFGAAGYYAARIADAGMLGLVLSNAYPKVAAHGGIRAALGTNPLAFSVPVAGGRVDDVVLGDLSTGALAGSRVREAIQRGESLAEGMALDADGRPTTDPRVMESGGVMLPAAGPKGFALGLMVELFTSVLGGGPVAGNTGSVFDTARPVRVSHTFLAIRPLDPGYADRAAGLLEQVRAASGPGSSVRIPGQQRARSAVVAVTDGIQLPLTTRDSLLRWAERLGVDAPTGFDRVPPSVR